MKKSFVGNAFLWLLLIALTIGFGVGESLRWMSEHAWLKWSVVFVTLFAMAWPLKFQTMRATVARPAAPLLAVLINIFVVPAIAWPFSKGLSPEFGIGLLVACAVPTTLATGPVWTRRAGGDDHIAVLVTVITNLLCFLVTPWIIFSMTGNQIEAGVFGETVWKLFWFVVLPIVLAQLTRIAPPVATWATRSKTRLSQVAQAGVLFMVVLGAAQARQRLDGGATLLESANQIALLLVFVIIVHVTALWLAWQVSGWLGFPPKARIAVAISGSQKTLMVGLSIAVYLGVSILPMIAYHSLQLVIDTVVAEHYRRRYSADEEE